MTKEAKARIRVQFDVKNSATVALLLYTIRASGGDLDRVVVVGKDEEEFTGTQALQMWEDHVLDKRLTEGG